MKTCTLKQWNEAQYEMSYFSWGGKPIPEGVRFAKPPPAKVWKDKSKFYRWVHRNGLRKPV